MSSFDVVWSPRAKRDLMALPEKVATAVVEFVYGPLTANPRRVGKPLRFDLEGYHSARRGDFRVMYRIGSTAVEVAHVAHRRDVYRRQ
jgi:mRNA interferase RelE/StbE